MTSPDGKHPGSLVVILGQTAVGKTELALKLAEAINGEIISADSRLVYRGMDIGAAKPSAAEQARVPHHLLDLVNPDQTLSLAGFQSAAYDAIDATLARGHTPLLVGGTGQYISAVLEGWSIPEIAPNQSLRAELEAFAATHGPLALWERLKLADPTAAEKIHPHNMRRVIRALEVTLEAGIPISTLQRKAPPLYRVFQIGLTLPREALHARIDARIDRMLAAGLVAEVRGLLEAGYDRRFPAMSGLGYRQIVAWLEGETTYEAAIEALRHQTRDFARRQAVWFRKYNRQARWYNVAETTAATIIEDVRHWLESYSNAANQTDLQ